MKYNLIIKCDGEIETENPVINGIYILRVKAIYVFLSISINNTDQKMKRKSLICFLLLYK